MKTFVIIFNHQAGTREEIEEVLGQVAGVVDWRSDMPNSFYLKSKINAQEVADEIRGRISADGRFLVTEISKEETDGQLSQPTWDFLALNVHDESVQQEERQKEVVS